MKVLYYLEPDEELSNPLFRLATIRNHLDRETRRLIDNGVVLVEVALLCSEPVAAAAQQERMLPRVRVLTIAQDELRAIYPDYLEASARWYNRDYAEDKLALMMELCARKLGSFVPDVILCYESNAPFLEKLFPNALFLHNTLGIFSRAPYPETSALDPFGIGKDSYLARFGTELRALTLQEAEQGRLAQLKESYRAAQLELSPLSRAQVRGSHERVVLLPLQVSRYFVFDENCPSELRGSSQLEFLKNCLDQIDPSIGVFVTMHALDAKFFTDEVVDALKAKHPNLIFSREIQRMRWVSQHVLAHVDAVVTVSSSLGLQALIWDLPVVCLGRSHLAGIASGHSLSELPALLSAGKTRALDGALFHLLTHYYPLIDAHHHRGEWFVSFLQRSIEKKQREGLTFSFFDPIDDPFRVLDEYESALRPELYKKELLESVRWGGPSVEMLAHDVTAQIEDADVVSFDVFDTLVTRPLANPKSVFDLVAPRAEALLREHGIHLEEHGGFRKVREEAGREASTRIQSKQREEYDLALLYQIFCERVEAQAELVQQLKRFEEEVELSLNRPRESGARVYRAAIAKNKRVILLSDMFLDEAVVEEILKRAGYTEHHRLYLSSTHGLLKRTSRLWERVRELEGNPAKWVHFGDHRISDVEVPQKLGIITHHLPAISDLYAATAGVRATWQTRDFDKSIGASLHHGVVSRRFYDRAPAKDKLLSFEGSAYRLGYEAGGALLLSFVFWVIEKAQRADVTDIYFLSRDGHLPQRIYDRLASTLKNPPRAHYLYASRRAYSVASLKTKRDIIRSLDTRPAPMAIGELLRYRFGVEPADVPKETLSALGAASFDDIVSVDDTASRERLFAFLSLNADVILRNAQAERANLLDYFEGEGLLDPERKIALVDIGNKGSLQVALSKLIGRKDFKGLYFVTHFAAREPYRAGLDLDSYFLTFDDDSSSNHAYWKQNFMFEFLFLPAIQSLKRITRNEDGTLVPEFVVGDESKRFELVTEVHRGILDYCEDMIGASANQPWLFELSKNDAARTFERFVSWPNRIDALMFDGVSFVDSFAGRGTRYLIAAPVLNAAGTPNVDKYLRDSYWKPGAKAILEEPDDPAKKRPPSPPKKPEPKAPAWERKLIKLLRNPQGFALDTKVGKQVRKVIRLSSKLRPTKRS